MNNSQGESRNMSCPADETLRMPLVVLYSTIFILGLSGNMLALWVFFFVHSKKNSLWVFLINLALADLMMVTCLPFRIQYHLQQDQWKLQPWLCKAVGYLFYMNMYISITLLGLISVDRYLTIYGSARTRRKLQSPRWSIVVCTIIWVVALALMVPFLKQGRNDSVEKCFHYRQIGEDNRWETYIKIFVLVVFWLVFISLMLSYGKIGQKLLRRSQQRPDLPNAARYSRTARKSFFILFLFIVCFVPYHIARIFYINTQMKNMSCDMQGLAEKFNEMTLAVSALNSCLDPVMFFLLSASIRREVRRFMASVLRVRDVGGANSTTELDSKDDRGQSNVHILSNVNGKEAASSSSN